MCAAELALASPDYFSPVDPLPMVLVRKLIKARIAEAKGSRADR